jgi:hypothetical protein
VLTVIYEKYQQIYRDLFVSPYGDAYSVKMLVFQVFFKNFVLKQQTLSPIKAWIYADSRVGNK